MHAETIWGPAAPEPPIDKPTVSHQRYLTFFISDKAYAVMADAVSEITHPLQATHLPNSSDSLLGISAVRGDIVALLDLAKVLGEDDRSRAAKSKTVLIKADALNASMPLGFHVDRVGELRPIPSETILPVENKKEARFLLGESKTPDSHIRIINCRVLISLVRENN